MTVIDIRDRLTWGEVVRAKAGKANLNAASTAASEVIGRGLNRNALAGVMDLEEAPTSGIQGLRAWVVLTWIGEDPTAWGVTDDVLPRGLTPKRTRDLLIRQRRWTDEYPIAA